mgnify:FL=1
MSLSHSQRDLVAQEVGIMHQVSYSSSVSIFCRNEIKDRNYKSVQQDTGICIFLFFLRQKIGWPPFALYMSFVLEIFCSPP